MKINSFYLSKNKKIHPLEIEIQLLPGLPQIQFLGCADRSLKESALKIKAALRHQGFKFPRGHQVLINLRPSLEKKKSAGLDLAIAYLILAQTEQIPKISFSNLFIYGELNLQGEVIPQEHLIHHGFQSEDFLLTGSQHFEKNSAQKSWVEKLSDLEQVIEFKKEDEECFHYQRPTKFLDYSFTSEEAELLQILAWGEHHALLAGPPGCGKTTLAHSLQSFLSLPKPEDYSSYKKLFPEVRRQDFLWRPVKAPHHSNTTTSLIGGGGSLLPGDLSRAHTGLLIMDEFLEFKPQILESLRQPLENGNIELSRGNLTDSFQTRFQLVATTNLCPCGKWTPQHEPACGYSRQRCFSVRQKVSGPLLDRFDVLFFKEKRNRQQSLVKGHEILKTLEERRLAFTLQKSAVGLRETEVEPPASFQRLFDSERRMKSCRRIALTLARMEGCGQPERKHWEKALDYTWWPFQKLYS